MAGRVAVTSGVKAITPPATLSQLRVMTMEEFKGKIDTGGERNKV